MSVKYSDNKRKRSNSIVEVLKTITRDIYVLDSNYINHKDILAKLRYELELLQNKLDNYKLFFTYDHYTAALKYNIEIDILSKQNEINKIIDIIQNIDLKLL